MHFGDLEDIRNLLALRALANASDLLVSPAWFDPSVEIALVTVSGRPGASGSIKRYALSTMRRTPDETLIVICYQ